MDAWCQAKPLSISAWRAVSFGKEPSIGDPFDLYGRVAVTTTGTTAPVALSPSRRLTPLISSHLTYPAHAPHWITRH